MNKQDEVVANRWFSGNALFENLDTDMPEMPKTDKQLRKEKRKAVNERKARREERRSQNDKIEMVRMGDKTDETDHDDAGDTEKEVSAEKKDLIRAGMGLALTQKSSEGFEVVHDERKYDSDHEDYDAEDYAKQLALGHMMMNHTKAKDLMDSSYNRYAWNDPTLEIVHVNDLCSCESAAYSQVRFRPWYME